ncbi:MAG: ATPase, partial [Mycobacteriaceae bacterium]|nr:ATPase [Mycobacteriaceae bacterium]
RPGGFGMLSMAERAELVGGRVSVRSRPGGGTTVAVVVPLGETPSGSPQIGG